MQHLVSHPFVVRSCDAARGGKNIQVLRSISRTSRSQERYLCSIHVYLTLISQLIKMRLSNYYMDVTYNT